LEDLKGMQNFPIFFVSPHLNVGKKKKDEKILSENPERNDKEFSFSL
jgi:hypothetical protein